MLEVRAWAVVLFESCGEEATQRWDEPPEHGVVLLSVPVIVGEDDGEEACDVPDEGLEDLPDEDDGTAHTHIRAFARLIEKGTGFYLERKERGRL